MTRQSPFTEVGWYEHTCEHEIFVWPPPQVTANGLVWCPNCRKTNNNWVRKAGYQVVPEGISRQRAYREANKAIVYGGDAEKLVDFAAPHIRDETLTEVLSWLAGVDRDLCAEMYTILSEGKRLEP